MMTRANTGDFLPASKVEMDALCWDGVDIVLVSGDAYVDHPSFGVVLIGRLLQSHGFRVAMLCQPRHDKPDDFRQFGRPRLFFGITAGNLDSIVSNYTGNGKVRDQDQYSPDGNPYFPGKHCKANRRRPDRAAIRYANLARQAYGDVPLILGGVEASLRRFVHYDYQQHKLRSSVLTDAKADLLLFGMAEHAIVEVARRLHDGSDLSGIAGSCQRLTPSQYADQQWPDDVEVLPSLAEINADKSLFMAAEQIVDRHARALSNKVLVQQQQSHVVVQVPAPPPLTSQELDDLYLLPFTRLVHPAFGRVPAWEMIRHSITIVRGCCGNCAFCAITRHQGPVIVSRSQTSILAEIALVDKMASFKGTISDLGGPTANLYGTSCAKGGCRKRDCLFPGPCRHLQQDEDGFVQLLQQASHLPGMKQVYVSSGLRMELLLRTPRLLRRLIKHHIPGAMKIAPEHCSARVLKLMHKEGSQVLVDFLQMSRNLAKKDQKKIHFTPYFISAHPGCAEKDMAQLAEAAHRLGLDLRHVQDFTPTPGTLATAMYVTGLDESHKPIFVARRFNERMAQRALLQGRKKGKTPQAGRGKKQYRRGKK